MSQPVDDDDRDRPTLLTEEAFVRESGLPAEMQRRFSGGHSREAVMIAVVLFAATCVSTLVVGMAMFPAPSLADNLARGLSYAGPLMLILLCHEMGHYLQSRRYHIPATLPIFLPMPFSPLGTMGAVIVQAAGTANRKAMFDIAVSGPLAGLVVALPVAWWGIQQSKVAVFPPDQAVTHFGDPLLLQGMVWLVHGPLGTNQDVVLNPLLYAGWVGLLLTGFNLLPIGQLDGGHIMYTLIGRRAHYVAMATMLAWVAYMVLTQYYLFLLMVLLLLLFGIRHPPTTNDAMPLGTGRMIVGWATMALLVVCITPRPFDEHVPKSQPAPRPHPDAPSADEPVINAGVQNQGEPISFLPRRERKLLAQ
jgi:Zn-dependent protease